jgi:hypothetical protein
MAQRVDYANDLKIRISSLGVPPDELTRYMVPGDGGSFDVDLEGLDSLYQSKLAETTLYVCNP